MKTFIEINKNFIIRDIDKMIFSAKDMKIFKFNTGGFDIANFIATQGKIEKEKLFEQLQDKYSHDELEKILEKMIAYNIVLLNNE